MIVAIVIAIGLVISSLGLEELMILLSHYDSADDDW